MTGIIVVEIPHRLPPKVWFAQDWMEAATKSAQRDGQAPGVAYLDPVDVAELAGHDPERNQRALDIAKTHGEVAAVQREPNETEWAVPGAEPELAEVVQEWIGRDLAFAAFLSSPREVEDFIGGYDGHQAPATVAAVRERAEELGWIERIEEDLDADGPKPA